MSNAAFAAYFPKAQPPPRPEVRNCGMCEQEWYLLAGGWRHSGYPGLVFRRGDTICPTRFPSEAAKAAQQG